MQLHLLQPMGGAGMRFSQDVGFTVPKPLIPIHGKPFFYWSAKSVTKRMPVSRVTFVVLQEHVDKFHLDTEIHKYFRDASIIILQQQLNGPVLTCLAGLGNTQYPNNEALLINDCDHMFQCNKLSELVAISDERFNALVTFKSREPCYSYIRYTNGGFDGTVEKQVVSEDAICGAYLYKNAATFKAAANELVARGTGDYSEFFLSDTYNVLKDHGEKVRVMKLDRHVSFGTPAEYRTIITPEYARDFIL